MVMTRSDDSAYRRGVVFGFTVAEVVLLLVFCLLRLFVPLLLGENAKTPAATNARYTIRRVAGLIGFMPGGAERQDRLGEAPPPPVPPAKDATASPSQAATPDNPPYKRSFPGKQRVSPHAKPLPDGWGSGLRPMGRTKIRHRI